MISIPNGLWLFLGNLMARALLPQEGMVLFTSGIRIGDNICKPIVDTKVKVFLRKRLFYQLSMPLPGLLTGHALPLAAMVRPCIFGMLIQAELSSNIPVILAYCPMSLLWHGHRMVATLPLPVAASGWIKLFISGIQGLAKVFSPTLRVVVGYQAFPFWLLLGHLMAPVLPQHVATKMYVSGMREMGKILQSIPHLLIGYATLHGHRIVDTLQWRTVRKPTIVSRYGIQLPVELFLPIVVIPIVSEISPGPLMVFILPQRATTILYESGTLPLAILLPLIVVIGIGQLLWHGRRMVCVLLRLATIRRSVSGGLLLCRLYDDECPMR